MILHFMQNLLISTQPEEQVIDIYFFYELMCLWNRVMNTCVAWSMWNYESGYLGFANELTQLVKWLPLMYEAYFA